MSSYVRAGFVSIFELSFEFKRNETPSDVLHDLKVGTFEYASDLRVPC